MKEISIDAVEDSFYPRSIAFGIIKERPFVDFTKRNSKEMSLEIYGDSVSKGDIVLIFKDTDVNFLNSYNRKSKELSVLSYENYKKFKKGLGKFIKGKEIVSIEEFPTASSHHSSTLRNCFFCSSSLDTDDPNIKIKRSTLIKKNKRSYESVGISHNISFHEDCAREFIDIEPENSPAIKEIISKKI